MVSVQEIRPETLQRLASLADANGFGSIDEYVAAIPANGKRAAPEIVAEPTAAAKAQRWEAWATAHAIDAPHFVDVSRDSIYTREDEAL